MSISIGIFTAGNPPLEGSVNLKCRGTSGSSTAQGKAVRAIPRELNRSNAKKAFPDPSENVAEMVGKLWACGSLTGGRERVYSSKISTICHDACSYRVTIVIPDS
jgi:hypothetical protein